VDGKELKISLFQLILSDMHRSVEKDVDVLWGWVNIFIHTRE